MGFWHRLEDRILALQRDRPRAARYMQIAWWIANAFMLVGVLVMFLLATGRWDP